MPNGYMNGMRGGAGGKRPGAGGGISERRTEINLPHFMEAGERRDGDPSERQITERAEAIRATWDEARWAKEKRRSERVRSPEVQSAKRGYGLTDSQLLRRLLWQREPPELRFGEKR